MGYDWKKWKGKIDVLTGGFPCQPFSVAGKRLGMADARHLWPAMFGAIQAIRPGWIVAENVRGLVSWQCGLVFEQVCTQLEAEGYGVLPLVLPAAGIGAPHRRERVWIVAHRAGIRCHRGGRVCRGETEEKTFGSELFTQSERLGQVGDAAHANSDQRCKRGLSPARSQAAACHPGPRHARSMPGHWENFPSEPPLCHGDDGLSTILDTISFPKWRTESIKGGGNAIVPQVALQLFKTIRQYMLAKSSEDEN